MNLTNMCKQFHAADGRTAQVTVAATRTDQIGHDTLAFQAVHIFGEGAHESVRSASSISQ
jgi:hypothetical protein